MGRRVGLAPTQPPQSVPSFEAESSKTAGEIKRKLIRPNRCDLHTKPKPVPGCTTIGSNCLWQPSKQRASGAKYHNLTIVSSSKSREMSVFFRRHESPQRLRAQRVGTPSTRAMVCTKRGRPRRSGLTQWPSHLCIRAAIRAGFVLHNAPPVAHEIAEACQINDSAS